jgi:ribokinase
MSTMPRVIVAGSINMDVVVTAARHPLPGETIPGKDLAFLPGGKGANQAVASSRLGVETHLVGRLGKDAFGSALYDFLAGTGVQLGHVKRVENAPSGTALIVVAENGENTIVVIPGANGHLLPSDVASVPLGSADVLVAQCEIPLATVEAFFRAGRAHGTTNIFNPAPAQPVSKELLTLCDVLVLNETELQVLTGESVSPENGAECCERLRVSAEQIVVLTLGKEGVVAVSEAGTIRVPGLRVQAVDTTGAGDCFVGALASRLALDLSLAEAVSFANTAAALSVQRFGAGPSMPTAAEVEAFRANEQGPA